MLGRWIDKILVDFVRDSYHVVLLAEIGNKLELCSRVHLHKPDHMYIRFACGIEIGSDRG